MEYWDYITNSVLANLVWQSAGDCVLLRYSGVMDNDTWHQGYHSIESFVRDKAVAFFVAVGI